MRVARAPCTFDLDPVPEQPTVLSACVMMSGKQSVVYLSTHTRLQTVIKLACVANVGFAVGARYDPVSVILGDVCDLKVKTDKKKKFK